MMMTMMLPVINEMLSANFYDAIRQSVKEFLHTFLSLVSHQFVRNPSDRQTLRRRENNLDK